METQAHYRPPVVHIEGSGTSATATLIHHHGDSAAKAAQRDHSTPTRSASAPGGGPGLVVVDAAPPLQRPPSANTTSSPLLGSLPAELSMSRSRAGTTGVVTPGVGLTPSTAGPRRGSVPTAAQLRQHTLQASTLSPSSRPIITTTTTTTSSSSSSSMGSATTTGRSADLEHSGLVPEERLAKLRTRWGIPFHDALVRVIPCVYKKPRPSHGKLWVFPHHLVFVSHSHRTNVCIALSEVEQMLRKHHRIHIVTRDKTHRLRGGLTQNSSTYGILLAVWQHAKGDPTIDLDDIRATDKKLQKAIRKSERRGSLTDTSDGISEDDYDEHNADSESDDDDPVLERHGPPCQGGQAPGDATHPPPAAAHLEEKQEQEEQEAAPTWEIPLAPQPMAPPAFAASLIPPPDAQNVNRVGPLGLMASVERCWGLLYASDSPLVQQSMAKNHLYDISLGEWGPDSCGEGGVVSRIVKYTKPMQSKFVKGDALVEQTQKAVLVGPPSKKLVLWQESRMQGVPYSDSFVIHAVYELSEEAAKPGAVSITQTAWVVWTKSPPRLLRGKIERGAVGGVEESLRNVLADAEAALLAEAQQSRAATTTTTNNHTSHSSTAVAAGSLPPAGALPAMAATPGASVPTTTTNTTSAGTVLAGTTTATTGGFVQLLPPPGVPATMVVSAAPPPGSSRSLQIESKYAMGVLLVLLLSVLANVILALWR